MVKGVTQSELAKYQGVITRRLDALCKEILHYKDWSKNPELHDAIRHHIDKPSKFKLFLIPRDHLKSSIITKGGSIYRMLQNPDIRILIANNTWDNSRKFLDSIRAYLAQGSVLSQVFGSFHTDRWNRDEIIIRQRKVILDAPTIATTGLEKEQTSQHYDLIIADDLVARENSSTPEQRQKVKDYINSLMALLEPQGELWVVGTRWSEDDAYGDLIEEGIWDTLVRSAYTDEGRTATLFPEKFSLEKLAFLRQKLGPYLFSCWYLNNPIAQEAADFKKEWIKTYDPTTPHPGSLYLTIDPAISLGRDADFTAMVVAGMFADRRIRVVDFLHKRLVPSDLVDAVFELVKKWRIHRVGIETFSFQKTLKYDIQKQQRERGIFFSIDELGKRHTGRGEPVLSKEARIRRLQPYFEQGLVELRADMQALTDELLAFPRGKHDDLCFVAGTKIATPAGDKNIEDLKPGDRVITPLGARAVTAAQFTGVSSVLSFDALTATANHPVFTYENGFIPLDTLTYQMELSRLSLCELYRWAYRNAWNSMGSLTDSWGRENIISLSRIPIRDGKIRRDFMWRCGSFIRARKFREAITFTTRTATRLITATRIWSAYRLGNTVRSLKRSIAKQCAQIWPESAHWLLSGIVQERAVFGIPRPLRDSGFLLENLALSAWFAPRASFLSIGPQSTAREVARQGSGDSPAWMTWRKNASSAASTSEPINILESLPAISPAVASSSGNPAKVYNLRVEGDHCYFANGLLVSNCDALSYQLDYLVPSLSTFKAKQEIHGSMNWWVKHHLKEKEDSVYGRFFADLKQKP